MIKINFAKTEHIDLIADFELENFKAEAYSIETIKNMMKDNYILKNNDNIFEISDEDDLIGYIIFHISSDFTDIYKIFIREKDRKSGLATKLVEYVESLSKRYASKKLMVEVRSQNIPAISFYERFGLKRISVRENYYHNPTDNAIIMEKVL